MLRKGEQRSPTDVCHVYGINVRCYVKAAGAQCASLRDSRKTKAHCRGGHCPPGLQNIPIYNRKTERTKGKAIL